MKVSKMCMIEWMSSEDFIHTFSYSRQLCEEIKIFTQWSKCLKILSRIPVVETHPFFFGNFLWKFGVFLDLVRETGKRCIQNVNWLSNQALWSYCDKVVIETLSENLLLIIEETFYSRLNSTSKYLRILRGTI